jgi:hypothetical protein
MPRRARQVAGTGIYHVMLPGVNRDPTESAMVPVEQPLPHGPHPRYSDDQVLAFLEQACGADSPQCFLALDRESQKWAIRDLRTRSVSFAQLAKSTGLSATSLKRMHAVRATPG